VGETCNTCLLDCGLCPAICGNGSIEPGEPCDDGNEEAGDGCSALCLAEFATDLEPGMVVITEIMKNPKLVPDTQGEWFEIMNISTVALDINGWKLKDADSDSHIVDAGGSLVIEPGAIMLLGNNADPAINGGVEVAYQYAGFTFSNGADEVILVAMVEEQELLIDSVFFNDLDFPDASGKTLSLDAAAYDQAGNDFGGNWCEGAFEMAGGDFGSPGLPNPGCLAVAVCGNGLVEMGEECDDGNLNNGDECDDACQIEYTCYEMLQCGLGCNLTPTCALDCYGDGDGNADSKALFSHYVLCVSGACGFDMPPICVAQATSGECNDEYVACAAD